MAVFGSHLQEPVNNQPSTLKHVLFQHDINDASKLQCILWTNYHPLCVYVLLNVNAFVTKYIKEITTNERQFRVALLKHHLSSDIFLKMIKRLLFYV